MILGIEIYVKNWNTIQTYIIRVSGINNMVSGEWRINFQKVCSREKN